MSLPWERSEGPPAGAGVCLSGGGLRAAAFAMGAVQALQYHRGLLFGARCAKHLAVVSGGSYLAATQILNSRDDVGGEPPLAETTGEAHHVVTHGEYLKGAKELGTIALWGILNLAAFAALFVWAGVLLRAVAEAVYATNISLLEPPADDVALYAVAVLALVVGGRMLFLRAAYMAGTGIRWVRLYLGAALLAAGAPSIVVAMERAAPLSDRHWWTQGLRLPIALGACAVVVGLALGTARLWPHALPARAAAWLAARVPAVIGAVAFALTATALYSRIAREDSGAELLVLGVFAGLPIVERIAVYVSLHRLYRDRLATCFAVRRDGSLVEPDDQRLSELAPPEPGSAHSFPRLLICATANVKWIRTEPARAPRVTELRERRLFASFVYSHDRCGLPGVADASFRTEDLERLESPTGPWRREQFVRLLDGVASTGAAVSPAMGRKTSDVLRPIFALTNLRLGRWLPNPLSARIREEVKTSRPRRRLLLGDGYDEFVPELFGLHYADAARVYVSDGGHYDNLGLLALLQARCAEIWCVDSQADAKGEASQLRGVLDLAADELKVKVPDSFKSALGSIAATDGVLGAGHVIGELEYNGGGTVKVVVIKLGLTQATLAEFADYRARDKPFPYHDTFKPPWKVMWYSQARMDAYRCIGYANALAASSDPEAPSVT